MHLEVLIEDRSGAAVMQVLLSTLLTGRQQMHTYAIRPHRGKGNYPQDPYKKPARFSAGLMDLLPAKSRAYAQTFYPEELLLIVIMDSDEDPQDLVYGRLESLLARFAKPLPTVIGICVEEMEAWLMGDREAILAAYPQTSQAILDEYVQDSICGTWEILARAIHGKKAEQVIKLGYPAVGQYKQDWARHIAPHLDPDRNLSPSFRRFQKSLDRILSREESRAQAHFQRTASLRPLPSEDQS